MKWLFLVATLLFGGLTFAEDAKPIAPVNPITLETEVGSTAGLSNKVTVTLTYHVGQDSISAELNIHESDTMNGNLQLSIADAIATAARIEEVANAIEAGKASPPDKTVGRINVGTTDFQGKRVFDLSSEANAFSTDSIMIGTDNAPTLAKFLRRAVQVAAWLQPKVAALQPGK